MLIQQRSAVLFPGGRGPETAAVHRPRTGASVRRPALLLLLVCAAGVVVWLLISATWGADSHNILIGARALVHRQPPTATNLLIYPSALYVLYMPLGLLPSGLVQPLTQVACVVALAMSLRLWGSAGGARLRCGYGPFCSPHPLCSSSTSTSSTPRWPC